MNVRGMHPTGLQETDSSVNWKTLDKMCSLPINSWPRVAFLNIEVVVNREDKRAIGPQALTSDIWQIIFFLYIFKI